MADSRLLLDLLMHGLCERETFSALTTEPVLNSQKKPGRESADLTKNVVVRFT